MIPLALCFLSNHVQQIMLLSFQHLFFKYIEFKIDLAKTDPHSFQWYFKPGTSGALATFVEPHDGMEFMDARSAMHRLQHLARPLESWYHAMVSAIFRND